MLDTPQRGATKDYTTRHSIRQAVSYLTNAHGDWVDIEDQTFQPPQYRLLQERILASILAPRLCTQMRHTGARHRAARLLNRGDRTGVAASRSAGPPSPTVARFPLRHVRNVNRCGYYRSDGVICHCSWFRWVASRAVIAICSMACHLKLNT